jgi:DNA-3-methyladenine glycosylase I
MNPNLPRCWSTKNPMHIAYHDNEWGVPLHDDVKLFEFIVLDGFQAGLSWWLILERREVFRAAFDGFDPAKVAAYTAHNVERILGMDGMIKNRPKIQAAIQNAQAFLKTQKEFGTFDKYIWQFVNGKTIQNNYATLKDLPAQTQESQQMSLDLKNHGFTFVGPVICYAFMQASGMVNDHLTCCYRHKQLQNIVL